VCLLVYVAVCCSVLQCLAICCSVLQCVAVCCSALHSLLERLRVVPWLIHMCDLFSCVTMLVAFVTQVSHSCLSKYRISRSESDHTATHCYTLLHSATHYCNTLHNAISVDLNRIDYHDSQIHFVSTVSFRSGRQSQKI